METQVQVRAANQDEARRWHDEWQHRIEQWYGRHGAAGLAAGRLRGWNGAPGVLLTLLVARRPAGILALAERDKVAAIDDIWVEPEHRGTGVGRAARTVAEDWARQRGLAPSATVSTDDPAARALFAGYPLRTQKMVKRLEPGIAALSGPGWLARPMTAAEYDPWLANEILAYAADLTGSGLATPVAAEVESRRSYQELLPRGLDSPGYTWWTVEVDAVPVGAIWLLHHRHPGLSFVYSVEVRPEQRGRGHGRTAMLAGEAAALAAGDRQLGLNVFGHNEVAMRLYDSLHYATVEQTRSASR